MSQFKRNNDLLNEVELVALKLNSKDAEAVKSLIEKYKSVTYEEHQNRHRFYQEMVSDMVNDCGFDDDGLAHQMAYEHPTIQQSFCRFIAKFIKKVNERNYADARNQATSDFCQAVGELANTHFPFI